VILGAVILGAVILGAVILGAVILGAVILGAVILGAVNLCPDRRVCSIPKGTSMRTESTATCRILLPAATVFAAVFAAVFAVEASFASGASAQARTFTLRNESGNRIQFVSDAPLETINGTGSHVTGELQVDPANLASARGTIRARIASLRTGIDLRDEHLRSENWLDANRYPEAVFEIIGVEGAARLEPNQQTSLRLRGRFSLHGVTREVVATAQVRFADDSIRGTARFNVRLTDFNISVPLPVRLKVANEIQVEVTIRANAGNG
jgi:polyisoprenoid-binding protein YceI